MFSPFDLDVPEPTTPVPVPAPTPVASIPSSAILEYALPKLPDPAYAVGSREYMDNPARINDLLYSPKRWIRIAGFISREKPVEVFARHPFLYHGRTMFPVFIKAGTRAWHQPFYSSSGQATPGASPAGTMWPISGIYTEAYCKKIGRDAKAGFIGKQMRDPATDIWHERGKDVSLVPPLLMEVGKIVAGAVRFNRRTYASQIHWAKR